VLFGEVSLPDPATTQAPPSAPPPRLVPRYSVASPRHEDIRATDATGCELRPAWVWDGEKWGLPSGGGAEPASDEGQAPRGLKGLGEAEVIGSRVRVWAHASLPPHASPAGEAPAATGPGEPNAPPQRHVSETEVRPSVGTAVGYVEGCGVMVQLEDGMHSGMYWAADGEAWEWLAPDEAERPTELFLDGATLPEMRAGERRGAQVRVWLPTLDNYGLVPCVGLAAQFDETRGIRVELPGRSVWVGNGLPSWGWVARDANLLPQESTPLPLRTYDEAEVGSRYPLTAVKPAKPSARRGSGRVSARGGGASRKPLKPSSRGEGLAAHAKEPKELAHREPAHREPKETTALVEGVRVELWGRDAGFEGSWYEAEIAEVVGKNVRARHCHPFLNAPPDHAPPHPANRTRTHPRPHPARAQPHTLHLPNAAGPRLYHRALRGGRGGGSGGCASLQRAASPGVVAHQAAAPAAATRPRRLCR